jgi:hypothetical protein
LHNDTLQKDIQIENQQRKEHADKLVKVENEVLRLKASKENAEF